jgi:hypothetical protein
MNRMFILFLFYICTSESPKVEANTPEHRHFSVVGVTQAPFFNRVKNYETKLGNARFEGDFLDMMV